MLEYAPMLHVSLLIYAQNYAGVIRQGLVQIQFKPGIPGPQAAEIGCARQRLVARSDFQFNNTLLVLIFEMTFIKAQLGEKAGPWRLGRLKNLQALVTEYQDTHKQGKPTKIFLDSKVSVNSSEFPCLQILSCRCWLTWPTLPTTLLTTSISENSIPWTSSWVSEGKVRSGLVPREQGLG